MDGTGGPSRRADVRVSAGRIQAVGDLPRDGSPEIDLSGLHLAPGFIDIHTHYDAQVLWDPDLTPSSWHGVTTAVVGNCGFGIAPVRPADHETLLAVLESVEDMPPRTLRAGVDWAFESFEEYLGRVDQGLGINVAAMIGHTPLRLHVMGPDAFTRSATPDEMDRMRSTLERAVGAGAIGFATSLAGNHVTVDGRHVPSYVGGLDEVAQLCEVLPEGSIVQVTRGRTPVHELARLVRPEVSVTWTSVLTDRPAEEATPMELVEQTAALGGNVVAQMSCRPLAMRVNLLNPVVLGGQRAFNEILQLPREQRTARYQDQRWRALADAELDERWTAIWERATLLPEGAEDPSEGVGANELAAAAGTSPFHAVLDQLASEDAMARVHLAIANTDEATIARLLDDERTILGLSDAGAHGDQLCDANFSTYLLGHWVRERQALSLERAVWRLTGQPASFLDLRDRGVIERGRVADLVAFDADEVAAGPLERRLDLPADGSRLVSESRGIEMVWVGGVLLRRGSRNGRVLRRSAGAVA